MQAFVNGRTITDEPRTSRGPFMFIPRRHVIGLPFAFLWSSKTGASASIFLNIFIFFFNFLSPPFSFFFAVPTKWHGQSSQRGRRLNGFQHPKVGKLDPLAFAYSISTPIWRRPSAWSACLLSTYTAIYTVDRTPAATSWCWWCWPLAHLFKSHPLPAYLMSIESHSFNSGCNINGKPSFYIKTYKWKG